MEEDSRSGEGGVREVRGGAASGRARGGGSKDGRL